MHTLFMKRIMNTIFQPYLHPFDNHVIKHIPIASSCFYRTTKIFIVQISTI